MPSFDLQFPDGSMHRVGGGGSASFTLELRNSRGVSALAALDELALGEAYLRGDIDMTGDFLACLDLRRMLGNRHPVHSALRFAIPFLLGQWRGDAKWVPRHYDFGNEFYWAFLDRWVGLYSQALYTADDETLEQAVRNKLDYIVNVCRLSPGSHVLDVGGGWGAL